MASSTRLRMILAVAGICAFVMLMLYSFAERSSPTSRVKTQRFRTTPTHPGSGDDAAVASPPSVTNVDSVDDSAGNTHAGGSIDGDDSYTPDTAPVPTPTPTPTPVEVPAPNANRATPDASVVIASAADVVIPELPDVRHWHVATPELSETQLEARDADLIMHAATAEARGLLRTARAVRKAAQRCDCAKEPEHPATIGVLCPDGCSGHGKCDRGCVCDNGWGGFGCWTELAPNERAGALTLVSAPQPGASGCLESIMSGYKAWAKTYPLVVVLQEGAAKLAQIALDGGKNVKVVYASPKSTLGERLNVGMKAVETSHALVLGPDTTISRYTNLEAVSTHLVSTDFLLIGGMVEQYHKPTKRWRIDHRCRQMHIHNYTLSQVWGYQATQRACMVCSAVSEVFATHVGRFTAFGAFDATMDGEAAFVDLFVRARGFGRGTGGQPRELVGHCLQLQFERTNECAFDPTPREAEALYKPVAEKYGLVSISRDQRYAPDVDLCSEGFGAVNTGHNSGLATNPCTLRDMETLVLQVGDALTKHGIIHVAAGEVYEGALKYQGLVPWARSLSLDAWVTADEFKVLHGTILPELLSKGGLASRVDAISEDEHSVQYVIHDKSGLFVRLSVMLISVGGATVPVKPYDVALAPLTQTEVDELPTLESDIGPDNLLVESGTVSCPVARMRFGKGSISVRKYANGYLQAVLGGDAWTLNIPSRVPGTMSVNPTEGGGVSLQVDTDAAVGYGSRVCDAGSALTSGCMDDWGWRYDWLNWEKQDDITPEQRAAMNKAAAKKAKQAKKKRKKKKKRRK